MGRGTQLNLTCHEPGCYVWALFVSRMMKLDGVIPLGYSLGERRVIEFLCNDEGLKLVPEPITEYFKDPRGWRIVRFAVTRENILALSLCGLDAKTANLLLKDIGAD